MPAPVRALLPFLVVEEMWRRSLTQDRRAACQLPVYSYGQGVTNGVTSRGLAMIPALRRENLDRGLRGRVDSSLNSRTLLRNCGRVARQVEQRTERAQSAGLSGGPMEKSTMSALVVAGGVVLAGIFQALALRAAKRKRLEKEQKESEERMRQFDSGHGIDNVDSD